MPEDHLLQIESNDLLGASYRLLTLSSKVPLPAWEPGQFAMLSLGPRSDPLLRRPFSIYNVHDPATGGRTVQMLYKILGRGSGILATARPGDTLDCLLPLGRGFAPARAGSRQLLLVAGGVGVASLHPLAAAQARTGVRPLLLFGSRTSSEVAAIAPTRDLGIETLVATEDGSIGYRGLVTSLLDATLKERGAAAFEICACGPTAMMKATVDVARAHGVRCWLSLESTMACGFGVCVGCVIGMKREGSGAIRYARTCIEGPVVDGTEVIW
jgi:dihydroorotate dehydrogenase electron transfer subunit